jgi:predicted DNA-binding WGR domain protein
MKHKQVVLNWRNVDPETNKRRWYHLHTSFDLWHKRIAICRWGRLEGQQNEQIYWYDNKKELRHILHRKIQARKHHGYETLS